ncbi:aminoglycoside phosphotransferase family protein [Geomonas sp. Red69]|uniref:Aminoglycoside phosphotransferase family protein n=1 Tax=Geomonas diazotrophica TaxID=2843197 RepID=A0ABX8JFL6_9BACT|nr:MULTISPECIES: aminoglycoside phosphotransferase family protein [Geomonas]MBU5637828.1 aminoglycoside phosphotransferase family protein [Geomonas diazotrophica]QWV96359.1 aminoglycoside phosphotransferase family protein [Geomonas nitrogeniifigens]
MSTVLLYDDSCPVPGELTGLIGAQRFGDIVFRRQCLFERACALARRLGWPVVRLETGKPAEMIDAELVRQRCSRVVRIAGFLVPALEAVALDLLERIGICADSCQGTMNGVRVPLQATSLERFRRGPDLALAAEGDAVRVPVDGAFVDVSEQVGLLDFLSGSFNSRHFNNVTLTLQSVVKRSANARKIRAEHDFYGLLPESMRRWFVMPYDLTVGKNGASYAMERLLMLDMGQQWINGGFDTREFARFLEDILHFLDGRARRSCSRQRARANFDRLYLTKVRERQAELHPLPLRGYLDDMLRNGSSFPSLERLLECYLDLVAPYRDRQPDYECIGHGDLCFSNILYDKRIRLLKLIDPLGAGSEDELYTDPFYDYAKLSHSVLGGYDFVVNGLSEIVVGTDLRLQLHTPEADFDAYAAVFLPPLEAQGIDLKRLRLYEASLFLSMLPLHIESPHNILTFALIAAHILKEVGEQ